MALSLVRFCMSLAFLLVQTIVIIYKVTFFVVLFGLLTENCREYDKVPCISITTSAEKGIVWYLIKDSPLIILDLILFY